MGERKGGWVRIKQNGIDIDAKSNATFVHGGEQRTGQTSGRNVTGYTGAVRVPGIKGTIIDSTQLNLAEDIMSVTNALIEFEMGNGKIFVLEEAWYSGNGEVNGENGEVNYEFEGLRSDEFTV